MLSMTIAFISSALPGVDTLHCSWLVALPRSGLAFRLGVRSMTWPLGMDDTKKRDLRYHVMLESVCGGAPGKSAPIDEQYRLRSAAHWLANARGKVNLSINTGITDGHDGSVPVGHTLRAFNAVAETADYVSEETIAALEREPKMPAGLVQSINDESFGDKRPLVSAVARKRRKSPSFKADTKLSTPQA